MDAQERGYFALHETKGAGNVSLAESAASSERLAVREQTMLYLRGFFVWLGFLAVAVLAGAAREFHLTPLLGDTLARAVGSVFLCVVFLALMRLFIRRRGIVSFAALFGLGAFWTALTLAFEFGFGFWQGLALEAMLADYNICQGRLWTLVLLTLLFGPPLIGRIQGR